MLGWVRLLTRRTGGIEPIFRSLARSVKRSPRLLLHGPVASVWRVERQTTGFDELRKRRWRPPLLHESDSLLRAARPAAHCPSDKKRQRPENAASSSSHGVAVPMGDLPLALFAAVHLRCS
jgi:hypothetical protein